MDNIEFDRSVWGELVVQQRGRIGHLTWKSGVFHASQACTYRVDVWWTQHANRSTSVPITVSGHTGGPTTKNFNERINGGKWNTHGTLFPWGCREQSR